MEALKNLFKFITFMAIFVFLLFFLSRVFVPAWGDVSTKTGQSYAIEGFYYEKANSLDVIFIGDSNLYKGISPLELWEDYGITSYNYSAYSARIQAMYYLMQDALREQNPKVIVMDTATLFYKKTQKEPEKRKAFDYMRFSTTKLNAIKDFTVGSTLEEKLSYVLPIFRYHSRWGEVQQKDYVKVFDKGAYFLKGYGYTDKIVSRDNDWDYMVPKNDKKSKMTKKTEKYFKLIVDYCKKNDIKLLMIGIPDNSNWKYKQSEAMKDYAKKYDVDFLELSTEESGYNWQTDTSDHLGVHSNIFGAEKLTKMVGEYLDEIYDLPDHREDKEYKSWNDDLKIYNKKKEESYKKLEEFNENNNKEDKKEKHDKKRIEKSGVRTPYKKSKKSF